MIPTTTTHLIIEMGGLMDCGCTMAKSPVGALARCSPTRFQTVHPVKKSLLMLSRSVSRRRETFQMVVCDGVKCPNMVSVLLKTISQVEHFGRIVEALYKRLDRPNATLAPTPTCHGVFSAVHPSLEGYSPALARPFFLHMGPSAPTNRGVLAAGYHFIFSER